MLLVIGGVPLNIWFLFCIGSSFEKAFFGKWLVRRCRGIVLEKCKKHGTLPPFKRRELVDTMTKERIASSEVITDIVADAFAEADEDGDDMVDGEE